MHRTDRCRFLIFSVRMGEGCVEGFDMNSEVISGGEEGGGRGAFCIIADLLEDKNRCIMNS